MRSKFCFLFLLITFVSCKTLNSHLTYKELLDTRSQQAKLLEKEANDINCNPNSHQTLDHLRVNNNLWGMAKLKGKPVNLCTFVRADTYGWKWDVDNKARGIIGFPALQVGPGPWNVTKKIHGFPIQVSAINTLEVDYATEMYVKHKKYNLAFDLWLSSDLYSTSETITTEIMIWEDWFDFSSYGKVVDQINTPFGDYEVYSGYLKNEAYNQDWNYFAFVRKEKRQEGKVDLKYLLDYLVKTQGVDAQQFLTSIELGNEIGNSKGFTLIKKFDLNFN